MSNQEFYDSRPWQRIRYQALLRNDGRCECCGNRPTEGAPLHVDHIKPRSRFPALELDLSNLQVLCRDCNLGKSNKDATDWREQWWAQFCECCDLIKRYARDLANIKRVDSRSEDLRALKRLVILLHALYEGALYGGASDPKDVVLTYGDDSERLVALTLALAVVRRRIEEAASEAEAAAEAAPDFEEEVESV
jgi:hypothetical protein